MKAISTTKGREKPIWPSTDRWACCFDRNRQAPARDSGRGLRPVAATKSSARDDDEIRALTGFAAEIMIGNNEGGAGDHQLGNALDHALRNLDARERALRGLRRRRIDDRLGRMFLAKPAPGGIGGLLIAPR